MRFALVLSTLFSFHFAFAEMSFKCSSEMPTTDFELRTEGDDVVLSTLHHFGTEYMPIHEGIIVPHDLKYLQEKSPILQSMGDRNEIRFPLKKCKIYGPKVMSCSGGERKKFKDVEMEALMIQTSLATEKTLGMSYEFVRVTLSLNITGYAPVQELNMKYYGNECKFGF